MTRARDLSLYTLQSVDGGFLITKFDSIGLEILSQYEMMGEAPNLACPCPQGLKPSCRHRKMFPMMVERVDKPWFFCYDTGEWKPMTSSPQIYGEDGDPAFGPGDDNGAAKPYAAVETVLAPITEKEAQYNVRYGTGEQKIETVLAPAPAVPLPFKLTGLEIVSSPVLDPSPAPKPMRRI